MVRRSEDFKSVFRWARREIQRANMENFASQGAVAGKPWLPLDDEYARWKLANHGPLPILIVSGSLRDSLTRLRGRPNEIDKTTAVFGTAIPYAGYHQTGTRHMPKREVMFVPPMFAQALAMQVSDHILHGKLGVSSATSLLKGTF